MVVEERIRRRPVEKMACARARAHKVVQMERVSVRREGQGG